MAHIRKAALVCDKCGERLDIDPEVIDPFFSSILLRDSAWRDWSKVAGRHLCPTCSAEYREVKAECDRMMKEASGARTIECEL